MKKKILTSSNQKFKFLCFHRNGKMKQKARKDKFDKNIYAHIL